MPKSMRQNSALIFFLFFLITYFGEGVGWKRGREGLKKPPCWARGSVPWPWDHHLSQNQESWRLNQPSHPGTSSIDLWLKLLAVSKRTSLIYTVHWFFFLHSYLHAVYLSHHGAQYALFLGFPLLLFFNQG